MRVEQSIAQCAQHFQALDAALAAQPFAGDTLTLADIAAGTPCIATSNSTSHDRTSRTCKRYERLKARPAYRTHVMIPFDDLRGRLD